MIKCDGRVIVVEPRIILVSAERETICTSNCPVDVSFRADLEIQMPVACSVSRNHRLSFNGPGILSRWQPHQQEVGTLCRIPARILSESVETAPVLPVFAIYYLSVLSQHILLRGAIVHRTCAMQQNLYI